MSFLNCCFDIISGFIGSCAWQSQWDWLVVGFAAIGFRDLLVDEKFSNMMFLQRARSWIWVGEGIYSSHIRLALDVHNAARSVLAKLGHKSTFKAVSISTHAPLPKSIPCWPKSSPPFSAKESYPYTNQQPLFCSWPFAFSSWYFYGARPCFAFATLNCCDALMPPSISTLALTSSSSLSFALGYLCC